MGDLQIPPDGAAAQRRRHDSFWLRVALLAGLTAAVYAHASLCGFVWDDVPQVRDNPYIRSLRFLPMILTHDLWVTSGVEAVSGYYRPLQNVSYALDYRLFGLRAWGYHLTNVLLHFVIVVMLFQAMRRTRLGEEAAFVAAAIFAVHPLHVGEVTFIAGRGGLLAAALLALALLATLRAHDAPDARSRLGWLAAMAAAVWVAMLAKPLAIAFPCFLALVPFVQWPDAPARRKLMFAGAIAALGFAAIAGAFAMRPLFVQGGDVHQGLKQASMLKSALCLPDILGFYARRLLLPIGLNVDYDLAPPGGLFSLPSLAWLALLAPLGLLTLVGVWRGSPVAFWAALFWIVTGPLAGMLAFPQIVADRYMYLPVISLGVLIGALTAAGARRWPRASAWFLLAAMSVALVLGAMAIRRGAVFLDDLSLFSDAARKSPHKARTLRAYAGALERAGRRVEADAVLRAAEAYNPAHPRVLLALAAARRREGRRDEAARYLARALEVDPNNAPAMLMIADDYEARGDAAQAYVWTARAVQARPRNTTARTNLAVRLLHAGQSDAAARQLAEVLRIAPLSPIANEYLGVLLLENGHPREAAELLWRATIANPKSEQARRALAEARAKAGGAR
jgi:Tfp pilus assembly protein PilF